LSKEFDHDRAGNPVLCRDCKAHIKMVQENGKWYPRNLDGSKHDHKTAQPKTEQVQQELKETGKMLPEAEKRVRELAREEIVKFYVEIATKYEKAKP